MLSNFKLLSSVNQKKKTKCLTGDFIDNQRSLKYCVQIPGHFRLYENMLFFRF